MEIFKLKPAGRDSLWGGTKLKEKYGKNLDLEPLAETWECSTHSNGSSIIENGQYKGEKLSFVIKKHPDLLGKKHKRLKELPILVKFIDADKDLSVQVHPNDHFAKKHEKQNGKTEMWYVVEAEKGAKLVYGFEHPVTDKILKEAICTGDIEKHLHYESVHVGDSFYMPAGTVHAIGKGILIAEIQQNSDVTYRVYDYNRKDKYGNKRELHFEKALRVMDKQSFTAKLVKHKLLHYFSGGSRQVLQSSQYFQVEKICLKGSIFIDVSQETFQIFLCLDGGGQIKYNNGQRIDFSKGDCLFVSAESCRINVTGNNVFLKISS